MPTSQTQRSQIGVLIADAHPLFRDGLARTIDRDAGLRLTGELDAGPAALAAIRRNVPHVAILGCELDPVRIIRAITQLGLATCVVVLANEVRRDPAFEAVAAGARGYLSKHVKGEIVCDSVRRVIAGETVLSDEALAVVMAEMRLRHPRDVQALTPRELEVLQLMGRGLKNSEIGDRLHLAPTTVKTYCGRLYGRLGVTDRLGAVMEGVRRGLID